MNIRGIRKTSLIDYPGRICTVLFSGGCNLRCRYCHNPDLACNRSDLQSSTNEEALEYIERRKNQIDGVTLSGGEPTLSKNIIEFIEKIKKLSLSVKLDTNGLKPDVVDSLIKKKLLDYVALDVKTSPGKYRELTNCDVDTGLIKKTCAVLKKSGIAYEIRTTCIPGFVTMKDLSEIKNFLGRVKSYFLHQFVKDVPLIDESFVKIEPYPVKTLCEMLDFVKTFSDENGIRGI